MVTKVVNKETVRLSYFAKLKVYLDICKILLATFYRFNLATSHNFLQERTVYYHRIITEFETRPKEVFLVKCDTFKNTTSSDIVKRSAQQFPVYEWVKLILM